MSKLIGTLVALSTMVVIVLIASGASAQPASVAFWVAGAGIDTAADVGIPPGPSGATNADLCLGTGDCPSGCPKPVQNFVSINPGGGGSTRLTDIVMSEEVPPGSKCRQFTAGSICSAPDPDNPATMINWYKFVATSCD